MTVKQLLATSHAFHEQAKPTKTKPRDRNAMAEAAKFRLEALAMDPNREDPAWAEEDAKTAPGTNTHEAMLAFYRQQGIIA